MTEYEAASLAYQGARMWVAAAIGLGQIAALLYGIAVMKGAATQRDRQLDEQRRDADQRHAEAMEALRVLIERTGR